MYRDLESFFHLSSMLALHITLLHRPLAATDATRGTPRRANENVDVHHDHYVIDGDVMLGAIMSIRSYDRHHACGKRLRRNGILQQVEAISFALDEVNQAWPPLLPAGLKLGAVILDDCTKPETALARALHFIPVAGNVASKNSTRLSKDGDDEERVPSSSVDRGFDAGNGAPLYSSTSSSTDGQEVDDPDVDQAGRRRYERFGASTATEAVSIDSSEMHADDLCSDDTVENSISPPLERFYDVVGVIGAESSSSSIMISNLLGMFGIPVISPTASSDVLSDKTKFPFFIRMAPPDRYRVDAMINIIEHFNWTYIAAVYSKNSYGENAVEHLRAAAARHSVCIGPTLAIDRITQSSLSFSRRQLRADVEARLVRTGVRIVVLFTDQEDTMTLLDVVKQMRLIGQFVWIGSDGLGLNLDDLNGYQEVIVGALALKAFSNRVPAFQEYFRRLTPSATRNPWFRQMWAEKFRCSWWSAQDSFPTVDGVAPNAALRGALGPRCPEEFRNVGSSSTSEPSLPDYVPESIVSIIIDSVHVFAGAIGRVLTAHCLPEIETGSIKNSNAIRRCITGPRLLRELRATNFIGKNGNISFDVNGDIHGKYEIINFRWPTVPPPQEQSSSGHGHRNVHHSQKQQHKVVDYKTNRVGVWDTLVNGLHIDAADIFWNVAVDNAETADRRVPLSPSRTKLSSKVPISQCGRRCLPGEVYSYFKDTCCWECRRCAVNEIATANATKCVACPLLMWPAAASGASDGDNNQTCVEIKVVDERWLMHMVMFFDGLAVVGVVYCGFVLGVYVRYRNVRLIKATSRELSCFMLAGICLQYTLIVTTTVRPPSVILCYVHFVGFHASFTVVYAPLLARTNRIYRIFKCARHSTTLPHLTSPLSQVIIALVLVVIQLLINAVTVLTTPPRAELRMPILTERLVEVTCSGSVEGFVTSLIFNVMLIVVCSWYAFKTRMLPDNFNESRYITLCVYTTLVIWLAFVPSYFTAIHSYQRIVLSSSALALNATVMLLCLFTPRIYAIYNRSATTTRTGSVSAAVGGRYSGGRVSGTGLTAPGIDDAAIRRCSAQSNRRPKVIYHASSQRPHTFPTSGLSFYSSTTRQATTTICTGLGGKPERSI